MAGLEALDSAIGGVISGIQGMFGALKAPLAQTGYATLIILAIAAVYAFVAYKQFRKPAQKGMADFVIMFLLLGILLL